MLPFPPLESPFVCFGELLLRLAAPAGELLLQSPHLRTWPAGAEANVAISLSRLGQSVRMVSVVPDQALGRFAADTLRYHGVDTGAVRAIPGRMGLYFLTPGAVDRPADIIYDRAGSAFATCPAAHYDWDRLLAGAGWLHVSGVTVAVSAEAGVAALDAVRAARRLGVRVSFDGNYRASMWAARGEDGAAQLAAIVAEADLAFIDGRDVALLLGRPDLNDAPRERAIEAAFAHFPRLRLIAATRRTQSSANHHALSAALHTRDGVADAPCRSMFDVVDRIGAGDAFAAGVLHGVARGWLADEVVRFALAAACSKHSLAGDAHVLSESHIRQTMDGGLDVRR